MSTPKPSLVKWVMPDRMIVSDEGFTVEELRQVGRVPVIPLADLAEVVEGLKILASDNSGPQDNRRVLEAQCLSDDDWWEIKGNGNFAQWLAQRLLASLGGR